MSENDTKSYANTRIQSVLLTTAKCGVTLWAASTLPVADGLGGPGTVLLPACLALCVAGLAASSGGMGAMAAWVTCKSLCIAGAVAADELPTNPKCYHNASF